MKKKVLLRIIRHNWQLKLLAVIAAVFLWMYVGMVRDRMHDLSQTLRNGGIEAERSAADAR